MGSKVEIANIALSHLAVSSEIADFDADPTTAGQNVPPALGSDPGRSPA
jgi:hypothetical protein